MQNLINLEAVRLLEEVEERAMVRQLFHVRNDPFELSNKDFIRLYRVNKRIAIAEDVINIVSEYINEQSRRSSALDINTQVNKIIKLFLVYDCLNVVFTQYLLN